MALYAIVLGNGLDPTDIESISFPVRSPPSFKLLATLAFWCSCQATDQSLRRRVDWSRAPLWNRRSAVGVFLSARPSNVHRDLLVFDQRHVLRIRCAIGFRSAIRRIRTRQEPWKVPVARPRI